MASLHLWWRQMLVKLCALLEQQALAEHVSVAGDVGALLPVSYKGGSMSGAWTPLR